MLSSTHLSDEDPDEPQSPREQRQDAVDEEVEEVVASDSTSCHFGAP